VLVSHDVWLKVRARPLAGFALVRAREEGRKLALLSSLLRGSVIYLAFILLMLLINYSTFPGHPGFLLRRDVAELFERQPCSNGRSFSAIKRHDRFISVKIGNVAYTVFF